MNTDTNTEVAEETSELKTTGLFHCFVERKKYKENMAQIKIDAGTFKQLIVCANGYKAITVEGYLKNIGKFGSVPEDIINLCVKYYVGT